MKQIVLFILLFGIKGMLLAQAPAIPLEPTAGGSSLALFLADLAVAPSYDIQQGTMYLRNGEEVKGLIKIRTNKVSIFTVDDEEKNKHKFDELDSLILEPSIGDDVTFLYLEVDKYDDLYKIIYKGSRIMLLTNYYSLGEKAELPNDYKQILFQNKETYGLQGWKTMRNIFVEDAAYLELAPGMLGKYKNYYAILNNITFLLDQRNPKVSHSWKESNIELIDGRELNGYAICQPFLADGSSSNDAYVNFFDGKDFHLFNQEEVKQVQIGAHLFKPYFLKNALEYVFARPWTYEGKEYVVIPKMARLSNYLIDEAKYFDQNNFSIAESVKEDKIKLAGNQKDLLKAFLNELRSEN